MAKDTNSPTGFDLVVERVQNKFPHFLLGISLLIIVVIVFSLMFRNKNAEVRDLTQAAQTEITPAMADATATPAMRKSIGTKIAEFFMPKKEEKKDSELGNKTYTVQAGDGLWNIADAVYKDGNVWTRIAEANKLNAPYVLEVGQKITLPEIQQEMVNAPTAVPAVGETTAQAAATDTKVTVTGPSYVVQDGECLWNIAESAYGDGFMFTKIVKANNISNPDLIYPGQRFVLPRN